MPGLPSPDQSIASASEKVSSSENKSSPIREVAEAAKRVIEKIRARITRPNPDPDTALSDIVKSFDPKLDDSIAVDVPPGSNDSVTAEEKSQTIPELNPQTPLDPEIEYQKALAETQPANEDPLSVLSKHIKQADLPVSGIPERKARVFNLRDKARHEALSKIARLKGVKDIKEFNRLVTYFESSYTEREVSERSYKENLSDDEKQKNVESWEAKGYDAYFSSYSRRGKIELRLRRDIPNNIKIEDIAAIRTVLETGIDPVPVLEALRLNTGFRISSQIFLDSGQFMGLLRDPNLPTILLLIQRMSGVPHRPWGLVGHDEEDIQLDALREFVKVNNVSAYSEEFFKKVSIIAKALNRDVSVGQLPAYHELINNPDKLNFFTAVMEEGLLPEAEKIFYVFDSLNELEKDNLLQPLTVLISSGVKIDQPVFSTRKSYESTPKQTQSQLDQQLLRFIAEPSVAGILQDQDKQAFAGILRKMNGKTIPAELAERLYPARQDLVTINNLIFHSLDEPCQEPYADDRKLKRLETLLGNEGRRKILVSPEFQKFIAKLQKEIVLEPFDFFREEIDIFDESRGKQDKREASLVTLFKARGIIDIIDPGIFKRILRPPDSSYNKYAELRNLQRLFEFNGTIKLLSEAGVPLNPDNFKDTAWISNVSRMYLLSPYCLQAIPQERRAEWVRTSVNLPFNLQNSMMESFEHGKDSPVITDGDITRATRLAEIISTSDFFPKAQPGHDQRIEQLYLELGRYRGNADALFTQGKPNVECARFLIAQRNPGALSLVLDSDMLKSFEEPSRSVLRIWLELPLSIQTLSGRHPDFPNLAPITADRYRAMGDLMRFAHLEYLDNDTATLVSRADNYKDFLANGKPSRTFIKEIVKQKNSRILSQFITVEVLSQYSDFEKSVVETWLALPDDLKNEVLQEAPDFPNVPDDLAEKYRVAAEIITRIRNSPSAEIKKIEKELIGQLWKLENPRQALDEVIGIFEKNNLPIVGRVYRVFETIYDNPGVSGRSILEVDLLTKPNLSPALKVATPAERREIIYRDLLSINIQSGNPQLRDYLEAVRGGEGVVAKMEKEGVNVLSEREQLQLGHFFDKMDMLYASSLFGRTIESRRRARHIDSSPTTSHFSLEKRAEALKRNFRVRPDQGLTDRISEMFLKPLGFTSIEEALTAMTKSKIEADARNRQFIRSGQGKIVLKAGDRFKGVNSVNMGKILERGAVAREYLGVSAGSDATPYDSDTSLILEGDLTKGATSAVDASMSKGFGDVFLLVRDRGQFGMGADQYESFSSGSDRHFGIRTGFASTEIDALVLPNGSPDSGSLDDLFMTIVQNGAYIPVGDKDGNIIFTPEQFDGYRKTFDGVSEYSANPASVKRVGIDESTYPFPNSAEVTVATRSTLDQLAQEILADRRKVVGLSNEIRKIIGDVLSANGVTLRGEFDTSIYGAELVDTGSTARGSNVPGNYDFDMSLQLDPNDSKRISEIADVVKGVLKLQQDASHTETDYIQVRGIGSQIIEGEVLDIDIGIGKRSDEGIFASSDSIAQKLESIRTTLGNEAYLDALANIVLAKKILKAGHAYKKLEDGGMGGIGVENWILLHNGNMFDAFQSFWQTSHDEQGGVLPYEEFAKRYKVFDAGLNIKFNRHDNFIRVLKPNGYTALVETIGRYLRYL